MATGVAELRPPAASSWSFSPATAPIFHKLASWGRGAEPQHSFFISCFFFFACHWGGVEYFTHYLSLICSLSLLSLHHRLHLSNSSPPSTHVSPSTGTVDASSCSPPTHHPTPSSNLLLAQLQSPTEDHVPGLPLYYHIMRCATGMLQCSGRPVSLRERESVLGGNGHEIRRRASRVRGRGEPGGGCIYCGLKKNEKNKIKNWFDLLLAA